MKRLLILLILASQPAWAGWEELGTTGTITHYWDPITVRKTVDGRRAWMMTAYEKPRRISSGTYLSVRELAEFDCGSERVRTLQASFHSGPMGTGETVLSDNSPGRWSVVPPGTAAEAQLESVCKVPLK